MKKLLVLALVLGVAGLASAGLMTVSQDTSNTGSVSGSGYAIVGGEPEFSGVYVAIAGATPTMVVNYAGNNTTVNDVTGDVAAAIEEALSLDAGTIGYVAWYDFTDTVAPPNTKLPNGLLLSLTGTGAATVWVFDAADGSPLGDDFPLTFVPEPMTLALLGLGGLFIRRRK